MKSRDFQIALMLDFANSPFTICRFAILLICNFLYSPIYHSLTWETL